MKTNIFRWLDPIILIGIVISITISVGMIILGNDSVQSFIVGLLSTLLTLLVDIIARLQRTEANLLEAAKFSHIISDEALSPVLQELAKLYDSIKQHRFPVYIKIADDNLQESISQLRNLSAGDITFSSRAIYDYTDKGIKEAKNNIKVTSFANEMDYWRSISGKKYLTLNQEAVKRGVKITRMFAMTYEQAIQHIDVLKEQEKAGINVLVIRPDKIDKEILLVDDKILIEYHEEPASQKRLQSLILEPVKVRRMVDEFVHLIQSGRTIKDLT